jgi:hypothetical protein
MLFYELNFTFILNIADVIFEVEMQLKGVKMIK